MSDQILFRTEGTLQAGGDVIWDFCTVTNFGTRGSDPSKALDILALSPEINLYEDIFSHSMYGNMLVVDTHNLINEFPFIGMETLYLGFRTPKHDGHIHKAFKIIKVSDRVIEGNKQTYLLHFISIDSFSDVRYSINRAYKGKPGTLIKQILEQTQAWDDYYSITGMSRTPLDGIETNQFNEVKLVSPQWSPIECIKWLEKNALNQKQYADYLFFETNQKYRFSSLSDLFQQDPLEVFVFDHSQPAGNPALQLVKVHDVRFPQINDNLMRFINRAYGQTTFSNDLFHKKLSSTVWDYSKTWQYNFDSTKQNMFPATPELPNFNISPDHNVTVATPNTFTHDMAVDYDPLIQNSRLPALQMTELNKLDIDIWGRTWLEVGKTVSVVLGKYTQNRADMMDGDDKRQIGNYLITAIHHRLAPSQHKMTMQLVRNSALNPYTPMSA